MRLSAEGIVQQVNNHTVTIKIEGQPTRLYGRGDILRVI
jgi:hypothetical protein